MPSGLVFERIAHSFGCETVLDHIDLTVPKGSLTAILGPSGCGKTTLLKIAAGLLRPSEGVVEVNGQPPEEARTQGMVGFAFQAPTLLPWRTALGNVLLPLELLGRMNGASGRSGAQRLLRMVGLEEETQKYPKELSGGMQQRVGLARALVTHPEFLLLDEPFGALDGLTRDRLNERVRRIWSELELTVLFVTHSIEEAIFLAEDVVILSGRPARVVDEVKIALGAERNMRTRLTAEFFDYQKQIRRLTEVRT